MPMTWSFSQVDVFAPAPLTGNPVAVVHDATGLSDTQMAAFAQWTNLSETTFLLPPTTAEADYRLRIFTPTRELPFAGHPTLGSAHAWLGLGGEPAQEGRVVQECAVGLVELRQRDGTLAFRAPDLLRAGAVDDASLKQAVAALGITPDQVVRANWIDNGPGWLGLELSTADEVLALRPDYEAMLGLELGVMGAHDQEQREAIGADYEVRAFCPAYAVPEDPVTGSLNAGFALWLTRAGHVPPDYVARQGTAMGRDGRVVVTTDERGGVWVGGSCHTLVEGSLTL
jgi:PhzF family phenazine biosynthesis protein